MNTRQQQLQAFERILNIMDDLRAKCPWDKKQTMESLRLLTIEEVYELGEAILDKDMQEIKKELGDVLLHIVFYSKIGSEKEAFDIADVINSECEKLIYRHPHIYGDIQVDSEEEVKKNWEKLKLKKGNTSVLGGVPKGLPAMVKAYRMQEKAKGVGFDFPTEREAFDKVEEEILEFKNETQPDLKEKELGDVFFSLINYARKTGINPENALERTNQKFRYRFQLMEQLAAERGTPLQELNLIEQDQLWDLAKKHSS